MEDENKTYRSEETINIKDEINNQIKELFENIPFLLEQTNEIMNYSNEKAEKRSVNFFNKIIKELKEINQKIMNFNIFKFEKSDIINIKDISYLNPNNLSFNDNNLSNNSNSKAKDFYGSFYKSFEMSDYPLPSNKISINNTNNNNNNDLNIKPKMVKKMTPSFNSFLFRGNIFFIFVFYYFFGIFSYYLRYIIHHFYLTLMKIVLNHL